jgi:predicted HAD superfamily Cof-like phosphohydrolase
MSQFQQMVTTFNRAINATANRTLRANLIEEEAAEFIKAVRVRDPVEAIDGLCDLLYVIYGAAEVFDMPLETKEFEEGPISSFPRWNELEEGLEDFQGSVDDCVASIFNKVDRKHLHESLMEVAEACWAAGSDCIAVDLRPFFREVHRTNMHKVKHGIMREDGKILKPTDWKPPRIATMLQRVRSSVNSYCEQPKGHMVRPEAESISQRESHPEGGEFCVMCAGLLVDWED